jgi:hypothetical protein
MGKSTGPESILIDIIEIIRGVRNLDGFMAEPGDILDDGIKVLVLFSLWVCIVESKYRLCRDALPPRCLCLPKVEGHGLCMPEVKVAIWLGWEARPVPATSSLIQIRHQTNPSLGPCIRGAAPQYQCVCRCDQMLSEVCACCRPGIPMPKPFFLHPETRKTCGCTDRGAHPRPNLSMNAARVSGEFAA